MALKSDLETYVSAVFAERWTVRNGESVPDDDTKLGLKNDGVKIDGVVLYADLADSTMMVDKFKPEFSAEIYKTFLYCCARIVASLGGKVTAYDGDRIMGVFVGASKNTSAVKAAMQIKWAVEEIVQPKLRERYTTTDFKIQHVTGVDGCELLVAKTGARGANDLVWVGKAANHAAKLAALPSSYIYITSSVYTAMNDEVRHVGTTNMWEKCIWNNFNSAEIYRSTYRWTVP
jgi:class 3 adenylate cyclase